MIAQNTMQSSREPRSGLGKVIEEEFRTRSLCFPESEITGMKREIYRTETL